MKRRQFITTAAAALAATQLPAEAVPIVVRPPAPSPEEEFRRIAGLCHPVMVMAHASRLVREGKSDGYIMATITPHPGESPTLLVSRLTGNDSVSMALRFLGLPDYAFSSANVTHLAVGRQVEPVYEIGDVNTRWVLSDHYIGMHFRDAERERRKCHIIMGGGSRPDRAEKSLVRKGADADVPTICLQGEVVQEAVRHLIQGHMTDVAHTDTADRKKTIFG